MQLHEFPPRVISTSEGGSGSGDDGWSPILTVTSDGERRVLKIEDWTGGGGSKPAVGQYLGASGLVANAADAVDIRGAAGSGNGGTPGTPGADGDDGWSPQLVVESDGARRVLKIDDWVGGEGTKPTTGQYLGASGLVNDIADGIDIRGPQGQQGAAGATGPAGQDGATGPAGQDGATGPAGQDGATGPAGQDGATGAAGVAGSYERTIFRAADSAPSAPTSPNSVTLGENPTTPTDWSATPPSGSTPIWASIQRVARGVTSVTYTTPRRWDGVDGTGNGNGMPGADGDDGWSPLLVVESDGARRVLKVEDWFGGEGNKPTTGQYLGASGLVSTAGEATDIRGPQGQQGIQGEAGQDGADGITQTDADARYARSGAANTFTTGPQTIDYDGGTGLSVDGRASTSSSPVFEIRVGTQAGNRKAFQAKRESQGTAWASFEFDAGGTDKPGFALGPGTSGRDANLYREAANVLKTDDTFEAAILVISSGTVNGQTQATRRASSRTNLGLGSVATLNTGTASGNVATLGTGGTFAVGRIPNLGAGQITSGTFADARIPNLAASKITSGTFAVARIPNAVPNVDSMRNQRDTNNSLKLWSGTKAQYDAIATKDANTLYIYPDS